MGTGIKMVFYLKIKMVQMRQFKTIGLWFTDDMLKGEKMARKL